MLPEKNGIFSVKTAYHLAVQEHIAKLPAGASSARPDGTRGDWNLVWQCPVPQKVRICTWKLLAGSLATDQKKCEHHIPVLSTCRRCAMVKEDTFHAVIACPNALAVWKSMEEV